MSHRRLAALLLLATPLGCEGDYSTSCFGAGTRIATPDGEVAIENLQVGHQVLAYDESSRAVVTSTVTAVFRHEASPLGHLMLADGHTLRVTAEHPIYCSRTRSYRPAGELSAGEALLRLAPCLSEEGAPRSMQLEPTTLRRPLAPLPEAQTVYNISVAIYENYFADGLLVHNKTPIPPRGLTLPDCTDGQLITRNMYGETSCTQIVTNKLKLPDCSRVPGSVLNAYDGIWECMPRGTGSTDAGLKTTLNKVKLDTDTIETTLDQLSGKSSAAAEYCGQYIATQNVNGAITGSNGVTGVAGATNLCQKVPGCSHMCTVYELYESAAAGTLPTTISQSWVHMQSWQHNNAAQVPMASGLADNCSGWTYGLDDKRWYGTTVEWKNAPSGQKALHFASGPGVVACSARFPIACCR